MTRQGQILKLPWILTGLKRQSLNYATAEGGWSDDGEEIVLFNDNADAFVYYDLSSWNIDLY